MWRCHSATTAHRALPLCERPALVMPCHESLQGQMQPLQSAVDVVDPALGAAAGLGRLFVVGGAVLLNAGVFQMWKYRSATTAQRALPVCEWPAPGMLWATARLNAVSAVCSRCGGA